MVNSPNSVQITLSLVDNIHIYNKHVVTPKNITHHHFFFSHPVFNTILVANMITNINTINIVGLITIYVKSQKINLMHIIRNRIKHRTNICGPKYGNKTHRNKVHWIRFIIRIGNNIINSTNALHHIWLGGYSVIQSK